MSFEVKSFAVEWARYERRLRTPFRFGERVLGTREGVLLRVVSGDRVGYGEASPLAGVSRESLVDIETWISRGSQAIWRAWRESSSDFPASLRFAIESALLEIEADALGDDGIRPVRANAIVTPGAEGWESQIDGLWTKGFRCFKIKISPELAADAVSVLERIKDRADAPYKVRLDANQSFRANNILASIPALLSHPIEYWEDPLPYSDSWSWKYFRKESPFPIAIDGPLIDMASIESALESNMADIFILKPTVLGGFSALDRIFPILETKRRCAVVTSTLETEIGLRSIANYLARRPETRIPQGVASGSVFSEFFYEESPEWIPDFRRTSAEREFLQRLEWRKIP